MSFSIFCGLHFNKTRDKELMYLEKFMVLPNSTILKKIEDDSSIFVITNDLF